MTRNDVRDDFTWSADKKKKNITLRELTPFDFKNIDKKEKEDSKIYKIHEDLAAKEKIFLKKFLPETKEIISGNLITKLLPHQRRGLQWMLGCEKSIVAGGILADEMGLGKTIQILSLILTDGPGFINIVLAPVVSLNQWKNEIIRHCKNINVISKDGDEVRDDHINIILLSYGKIENLHRRKAKNTLITATSPIKKKSKVLNTYKFTFEDIFDIKFERLVLDEAHTIKDSRSSTNTAINKIKSKFRWGLTGTPVQNRVGDLYSLIKFLKIDPLGKYFCKKCDCSTFTWLGNSTRPGFCECGHFGAVHFGWWNRKITFPVKEFGLTVLNNKIFRKIKTITKHFILRRTKLKLEKELGLPSKHLMIIRAYFSKDEKNFYESIYKKTKLEFNVFIAQTDTSYINIFSLIQKLRMAANHPYLLSKNTQDVIICSICQEEALNPIKAGCGHFFCQEEAEIYFVEKQKCPTCKVKITLDLTDISSPKRSNSTDIQNIDSIVHKKSKSNVLNLNNWQSSTKIETLMQILYKIKSDPGTSSNKSIVFSQFVNFLEMLSWRLERSGFRCVKIYGSMSQSQRKASIDEFKKNPEITIFLISLKAGGLALNLTEANNVFLMDPWWNPAVEEQAMDRIHRIGQFRPINIYKIIIQDSIESKIVELQMKKKALFESTIDNNSAALERLEKDDLQFLFN
ncbi:Nucleotide excision repair protein RAD16 [Pseudoloma neurophilia]|uniref:Nucleotide excision repair protein RAD16 n=1 Tax=Pseudoloma neurophilia TaxID=146866 RepID=A0A0R0LWT4_9MICR|nr:Nucleotide excision repair protein RAD16 [Pseudoloma neurophilia]